VRGGAKVATTFPTTSLQNDVPPGVGMDRRPGKWGRNADHVGTSLGLSGTSTGPRAGVCFGTSVGSPKWPAGAPLRGSRSASATLVGSVTRASDRLGAFPWNRAHAPRSTSGRGACFRSKRADGPFHSSPDAVARRQTLSRSPPAPAQGPRAQSSNPRVATPGAWSRKSRRLESEVQAPGVGSPGAWSRKSTRHGCRKWAFVRGGVPELPVVVVSPPLHRTRSLVPVPTAGQKYDVLDASKIDTFFATDRRPACGSRKQPWCRKRRRRRENGRCGWCSSNQERSRFG
jgi:hypothetical protein